MKHICRLLVTSSLLLAFMAPHFLIAETWESMGSSFSNSVSKIFYSSKNVLYIGCSNGLMYSTNNGAEWTSVYDMYPINDINEDKSGRIYVTCDECLCISEDGLTNWNHIADFCSTKKISFDENGNRYLIAKSNGQNSHDQLMFNNGSGMDWKNITPSGCQSEFLFFFTDNNKIFLSTGQELFYSFNIGNTWNIVGTTDIHFQFSKIMKENGKYYALGSVSGLSRGIYESLDGLSWSKITYSPVNFQFTWIEKNPYSEQLFGYCGTATGLCVSDDFGKTWKTTNDGLIRPYYIDCIGFSPSGEVFVFCEDMVLYKQNFQTNSVQNDKTITEKIKITYYQESGIISVFPVNSAISISKISIFNSSGNMMQMYNNEAVIGQGSNNIYTGDFSTGTYFLVVNAEDKSRVFKFAVVR